MFVSDRRLYLTADRERVVEHGDPEAAFLLVGKGCELPMAEAKRFGLKERPTEETKEVTAGENKGATPTRIVQPESKRTSRKPRK